MAEKNYQQNNYAEVIPLMVESGHIEVTTPADLNAFEAFDDQKCTQLTIVNTSGVMIRVQQDGAGVALNIPSPFAYTFFGITNANQLGVNCGSGQTTVQARWES